MVLCVYLCVLRVFVCKRVGSGARRKWCCVCICVYFVRLCVSVWGVGQVGNGVVCVSVCIACVCV